jgi:hypothetical protein
MFMKHLLSQKSPLREELEELLLAILGFLK